jgi:tetratricopeptide (TPR) repeat protein
VALFFLTPYIGAQAANTRTNCPAIDSASALDPITRDYVVPVDRLIRRGEIDEAFDLITKDVADHPNSSPLEDALGRVLYRRGELMPAIEAINLAIKLDRCNSRVHYDAWRVNATAGVYQAAQLQLDAAHSLAREGSLIARVWANTQLPASPPVVTLNPPYFSFYSRLMDCDGIPVRTAAVVNPAALTTACGHIRRMLINIPNVRANLIARGAELHIMGEDQIVSDLPEFRDERGERKFTRPGDKDPTHEKIDVDSLAGALGGIYANCPEMNLLHLKGDGYGIHDEVCIHEFAHDIMNAGFDAGMRSQIEKQFKSSTSKGLWKGAYAATNPQEFWAEMSAWYFGAQGGIHGMAPPIPDPGPEALKAYDPETYALLARFYSGQKQPHVVRMHELKPVAEAVGPHAYYPAELLFINNTRDRIFVYLVDVNGAPKELGNIEPYSRRLQQAFTSQYWLLYQPRTKSRTIFRVDDEESQATINDPK